MNKVTCVLRNRWHFGAQVLSIPALYYLKKRLCFDEVRVFSKQNNNWFYSQFDWIDELCGQGSFFNDCAKIRDSKSLVSFQPSSIRYPLLSLIAGVENRVGFSSSIILRAILNKSILFDRNTYRGLHYLELLSSAFSMDDDLAYFLRAPFDDLAKLSELETHNSLFDGFNIVIMAGGGAGEFKKWGIDNFLSVVNKIDINGRVNVHWILGPDESDEKVKVEKIMSDNHTKNDSNRCQSYLHSNLQLKDISSIIKNSDLVLANDCGPAHIAQCMQKKFIGVYDAEKPEWYFNHPDSICIFPKENIKPDGFAIQSISVEAVVREAQKLISKG